MRQQDLLSTAPSTAPTDDEQLARDLFGNPIAATGPAAPTYRPRKPVQQSMPFETFTLGSK